MIATYDLAVGPVSFDFLAFLVKARMHAHDKLHIKIFPKDGGLARDWGGYDANETAWRLWNIVIPSCQLARATVSLMPERNGLVAGTAQHHSKELIEAARAGRVIPRLSATPQAFAFVDEWLKTFSRPVVTITIRDTNDPTRNSNQRDWWRFKGSIENRYAVIWLDDTRRALNTGRGWAELSVDLRCALYQRAAMNMHVANGPSALCWYTGAPFMTFCCGSVHGENWKKHWDWLGLPDGTQLPWATKHQRLIYRRDTFEAIAEEFERWASATN